MRAALVFKAGRRISYSIPVAEKPTETLKLLIQRGRDLIQAFHEPPTMHIEVDAECKAALDAYRKSKNFYATPKDDFDGIPLVLVDG